MRASAGAPMRVMMRMLATTYGRVGDLHAATRQRRIDRAHAVRDHVHRAAAHAAGEQRVHLRVRLGRRHPVVVRAGVVALAWCRRRSGARRARRRRGASGAASCPGAFRWLSGTSVPSACICAISAAFSASLPSHQWIASGWVSAATSATQCVQCGQLAAVAPRCETGFATSWEMAFTADIRPAGAGLAKSADGSKLTGISVAIMCST